MSCIEKSTHGMSNRLEHRRRVSDHKDDRSRPIYHPKITSISTAAIVYTATFFFGVACGYLTLDALGRVLSDNDAGASFPRLSVADVSGTSTSEAPKRKWVSLNLRNNEDESGQRRGRCLISCRGTDGVGHQMEAKLSCLGAAAFHPEDLAYVHVPMNHSDHGTDAVNIEMFFNVAGAVGSGALGDGAEAFDQGTMRTVPREPLPWVGQCDNPSWFDEGKVLEECAREKAANPGEKRAVFTADNCWDFFWCRLASHPVESSKAWYGRVFPAIREAYYVSPKPEGPFSGNADSGIGTTLTVAVHVRRGDSGERKVLAEFYISVVDELWRAAMRMGARPQIVVHTDGVVEEVTVELALDKIAALDGIDVVVYGRDSRVDLTTVVHHLVEADILVASMSSLSHAAGLLRDANSGRMPVIHPLTRERPGMVALGWTMINTVMRNAELEDDGKSRMVSYVLVRPETPGKGVSIDTDQWKRLDENFWDNLVRGALKGKNTNTT